MKQLEETKIDKLYIVKKTNMVINQSSLTHLYLPIIGSNALIAYYWLLEENGFITNEKIPSSLTRLSSYLNVTKHVLLKNIFRKLEGVLLIETYLDIENEYYLCKLNPPLLPKDFFNNAYLKTLMAKKLPSKYYERTIAHFYKQPYIANNVLNVSCNFQSFYESEIEKRPFYEKININETNEFDTTLINARLAESNLEKIELSQNVKKKIPFLAKLYGLHTNDVVDIIKHCVKEYEKINALTIRKSFADIYEKKTKQEPDKLFEIDNLKTILTSLSPINFIIEHEDRQLTQDEINLLQKLKAKYDFSSEIINILLLFSLIKNRAIVPNYILKISETLKKLNINTSKKVIKHLKNAYNKVAKQSQTDITTISVKKPTKTVLGDNNIELEDLVSIFMRKK